MNDNVIDLCKKLKALCDRGVGGERANANTMLDKLMRKHNITIEDIDGEKKEYSYFKVDKIQSQIFWQIVYSVIGSDFPTFRSKGKPGYKILNITAFEAIEIHAKYDFFWKLYRDELSIFREAFIARNNIYSKNSNSNPKELTKEEIERAIRVSEMAESIKKGNLLKQLKS